MGSDLPKCPLQIGSDGPLSDAGSPPIIYFDRKPAHRNPGAVVTKPREQETEMITSYEFLANWLRARVDDERGASLVEYALLVALIAVVCILAITVLGNSASNKFSSVGSAVN